MSPISAERRVRRLNLTAPDPTLAGRGVRLLDDALRTASLPDAGGRTIFVRRFALGRFGAGVSPQTLALALERRLEAVGRYAVHASSPDAHEAAAVWFRDTTEAHTMLALRILESASAREWFWPVAVPAVVSVSGGGERLRAIALALGALPEAPAALPAFAQRLVARSHGRALIECLDESDGESLLAAAGLPPGHGLAKAANSAISSHVAASAARRGIAPPPVRAGRGRAENPGLAPHDARVRWLSAMLGGAGSPAHPIAVSADAIHRLPPQREERESQENEKRPEQPPGASTSIVRRDPQAASEPLVRESGHEAASPALEVLSERPDEAPPAPRLEDAHPERSALEQDAWPSGMPSGAGGVLFLLSVLDRLGYPAWSASLPPQLARAIAVNVLGQALRRLRVPRDDPAHLMLDALRPPAPDDVADVLSLLARPQAWSDPRIALTCDPPSDIALACDLPADVAGVAALWLTACRRWLRRLARLGLASLVVRPARLRWSATHLDAFFDLHRVDVRVRRAGLDLDPGWMPWVARVVSFHYRPGLETM